MFFNKKDEERGRFLVYTEKVRKLSEKNFRQGGIPNQEMRKQGWHLDHMVSIKECYMNELPVDMAADPLNLQVVPPKYNLQKGARSTMTVGELIEEITERDDLMF